MYPLPYPEHVAAFAWFISQRCNHVNEYVGAVSETGVATITNKRTDEIIIRGINRNDFNRSHGIWWRDHYGKEVSF